MVLSVPKIVISDDTYVKQEKSSENAEMEASDTYIDPVKQYAYQQVVAKWGIEQWSYYKDLIQRESSWINTAQNPKSTAFGLHQFLNGTWSTVNCIKTSEYKTQIECGIKYIEKRYSTPYHAIVWHNRNNWY